MQGCRSVKLFAVALLVAAAQWASGSEAMQAPPQDPERTLTERFGFSAEEVSQARSGQPIAKMIPGRDRNELAMAGALRLDGDKQRFIDWVRNIEHFRHAAELGVTRAIGSPSTAQSFAELVLDAKDLASLQACRPGRCDLRLPDEVMAKFQSAVPWGTPEASVKANALFAGMLTDYVAAYLHGGDSAVHNDFGDILRSATTLYQLAPEFADYLQKFPASKLDGVEHRLYWTNLAQDPASIVSLHHLAVYRRPSGDVFIADKTFYASRFFDVGALVLSMQDTPDGKGYYLVAGSRARSSLLTGVGGRVARGQVERTAVATVKMYLVWLRDSLASR